MLGSFRFPAEAQTAGKHGGSEGGQPGCRPVIWIRYPRVGDTALASNPGRGRSGQAGWQRQPALRLLLLSGAGTVASGYGAWENQAAYFWSLNLGLGACRWHPVWNRWPPAFCLVGFALVPFVWCQSLTIGRKGQAALEKEEELKPASSPPPDRPDGAVSLLAERRLRQRKPGAGTAAPHGRSQGRPPPRFACAQGGRSPSPAAGGFAPACLSAAAGDKGDLGGRELLLTCPSALPQRSQGSSQPPSVQLWVSFDRKPMRVAQFVTKHPITVSGDFREDLLSASFAEDAL